MNKEVMGRCAGWAAGLVLAWVVACNGEPVVADTHYISDAITQICVYAGPAPVFHPLRGWVEMPQPSAAPGLVKLPVAWSAGRHAPRLWLCYRRGPAFERPLVAVQIAGPENMGGHLLETVSVPPDAGAGVPVCFYFKRADTANEPALTDILLRTKFEPVSGYYCDGQNLNEHGRGKPLYLYYQLTDRAFIKAAPFGQGISPEMLNAPDTEYEISRAQIDDDHLLVRLQKLEVKRATIAARMPFRRTETIRLGMSKQEMNQVARSLNLGLNDYTGLKACIGATLGWTSSNTYTSNEETTLTEEINLATAEHDRYYAFALVLDVLQIREIATGKVIREAMSRTENIGYFVTDKYGRWESAPLPSGDTGR